MKTAMIAALTAAALAGPAAACQWCMQNNQYDGSNEAPPPAHVPAVITKSPKLDKDDVAFILALESGKRYMRLGDYVADRTIRDLWGRLLEEPAIIELLRPRCAAVAAALREKAAKNALTDDDRRTAQHLNGDLAAALTALDQGFLRGIAPPASAAAASAPQVAAEPPPSSTPGAGGGSAAPGP